MSKYLKKYNETTGEWEIVSSPDVSVIQQLEDGSDITDTNVKISNYHYVKESGDTTLDETLSVISEDISRLQRNVSWLAEHGGGGSGSGGGTSSSFGIVINSPVIENGKVYISGTSLKVEFMITGGSEGDICTYAYQFDSEALTDYKPLSVNTIVTLNFEMSASTLTSHSLIIRAINPYGNTIAPKSFNIYLSTLSLVFDKDEAGESYKDGVFNIRLNGSHAYIPLIMTNGLEQANIVITAKNGSNLTTVALQSVAAGKTKRQIDFWSLIPQSQIITDNYYIVTISAESTILGEKGASSEPFEIRIRVINPSEITISVGINGVNTDEELLVPAESIINYNFKVYTPSDISRVYYAAKIVNKSNSYLILGKYYDENLHEEGATLYSDNDNIANETTVSSHYALNSNEFAENDHLTMHIKVWPFNGGEPKEIEKRLLIGKVSNDIFPRQIPKRDDTSLIGNTMFASWNRNNASEVSKTNWTSLINSYDFLSNDLKLIETAVTLNMQVLNNNDASGIQIDNNVPYLRLQNRAYAKINFSKYAKELDIITNSENSSSQGFTISLTVMSDYHTDTKHTIFLWGNNNSDGTLSNGIKIDTNKIYWYIIEKTAGGNILTHTLSCNFATEERNSVDFSFTKGNASNPATARIYINGVLNSATNLYQIHSSYKLPEEAYIGVNFANGSLFNYSDINLYDFSIYTKTLSDFQIVINGKNNRLPGAYNDPLIIADYSSWKIKNFIKANETDISIPESVFFNENGYEKEFDAALISNIAQQSNIPTLSLFFPDYSDFTSEYFYSKKSTQDTGTTYECQGTYYDPETQSTVNGMNLKVSLQGTSTLGYRIKNLEMYINEMTTVKGVEKVKLFQPKKEWLPESQFTLKADVVDSAHANNAVLGEWINKSGVFEDNPAMANFNENTRPKDVDDNGNIHKHLKPGTTEEIDYYEDVSIKHTLEGFPILLFIKFGGKDANSYYSFIGIYSFNLGRYSYYNMGMKFLKNFSRRSDSQGEKRDACPKIINYYEETNKLGSINETDVYSFEFGNAGNLQIADYPVWSQYDRTIIETYGDFKYPENVGEEIWVKLCNLFKNTSEFKIDTYNGDNYKGFDDIYYYEYINDNYVKSTWKIPQDSLSYTDLVQHLNINNAAAYFIVANAFGMTDSLGKNLTLRTWNGGDTWWTCFYDMDTALGLTNDGSEDNPVTVSIDKVNMTSDTLTQTTILSTTYHDKNSKYAAYLSKLWGILRCDNFLYKANKRDMPYYEEIWNNLRKTGGKLSKASNFTDIMAERIGTCGELIYNYDYTSKYIQDANEQEGAAAAITFLHGTRINFVKDWLTRHFYFLDGLFDAKRLSSTPTYEDCPYNSDILTLSCIYNNAISKIIFDIQVTTPSFIGITVGNDAYKKFYIEEANKSTSIYLNNATSSNSQITIKGSSLISEINGLQGGFQNISSTNEPGVAKSLNSFNASNSENISSESPFNEMVFLSNGRSSLESINLSNTHGASLSSYKINLEGFNKLLNVDINTSDVTALILPKTQLQNLNITKSKIINFSLLDQNIIDNINFEGCDKLNTVSIENCNAITSLDISKKPNLNTVAIINNDSLKILNLSNDSSLTELTISNNKSLETISINNVGDNFQIEILSCPALKSFTINNCKSAKPIKIDSISAKNIINVNFNDCYNLPGISYDGQEIEQYEGTNVFDISPMEYIENASFNNIFNLTYLRVPNYNDEEHHPFKVSNGMFGTSSIKRIFGYIDISGPYAFERLGDFEINDLNSTYSDGSPYSEWRGDEPSFVEDEYFTNIVITTKTLEGCFASTNVNLGDLYYVFRKCNNDIESVNSAFRNCRNIYAIQGESDLNGNLFKNCHNITNADYLFDGCVNISGKVSDQMIDDITANLESFINVFPSGLFFNMPNDDDPIFNPNNKIKTIEGFEPIFSDEDEPYIDRYVDTRLLLRGLENVETIKNSFNITQLLTSDIEEGEPCELLKGLIKLQTIENSFNCKVVSGNIYKLICDKNNLNSYSKVLKVIKNSFNLDKNDFGSSIFIGNSFFASCKNRIEDISGSFTGELFKRIDYNDCNELKFPYEILKGCNRLKNASGLFKNLIISNITRFEEDEETGEMAIYFDDGYNTITLPSYIDNERIDIFGDCTLLENISSCFKGMNYGYYELVGNGFKNNSLVNVSELFSNSGSTECYKIGQIPYKLFYQEKNGNINPTIENMSNVFEHTNSSAVTSYTLITDNLSFTDLYENNENYGKETGETKYVWNIWLHDGTNSLKNFIEEQYDYIRLQELYEIISEGASTEGYEDLLDENEMPILPKNLPEDIIETYEAPNTLNFRDFGKPNSNEYHDNVVTKYFKKRNFICPPDLFRYCKNAESTLIDGVFKYCSDGLIDGDKSNGYNIGYYGTIPPYLLKLLSNIISINALFENFRLIIPYRWASRNGAELTNGNMYPEIFKYSTKLTYLTSIFKNTNIMGHVTVQNIFNGLELLKSVSAFWENCSWLEESKIDSSLFTPCYKLTDISNLFKNNGPKYMYDSLFNSSRNSIYNCASFMENNGNTSEGSIPDFWNFYYLNTINRETQDQVRYAYRNVSSNWNSTLSGHQDFTN